MAALPIFFADRIAATGQVQKGGVNLGQTRVRYLIISPSGAGSIVIRDGGAGGVVKFPQLDIAAAGQPFDLLFPDEGLMFNTNVHITIVACAVIVCCG